jgi:DNA-binding NtrC family response regulator
MRKPEEFKLLIVDDEVSLVESLEMNYKLEGFNVYTANGGFEALEVIKNNKIDFVISDIRMPDGDGEMLLKELKKNNPEIPVVLLMTGFSKHTKEEVIKLGALDLLSKPIDLELLDKYLNNSL